MPRVPVLTVQDQGLAAPSDRRVWTHCVPHPALPFTPPPNCRPSPEPPRDSTVSLHHHLCDTLLTVSAHAFAVTSRLLEGHNFKGCALHTLDRNFMLLEARSPRQKQVPPSPGACVHSGGLAGGYKRSGVLRSAQNKQNLFPEPFLFINVKMPPQPNLCVTTHTNAGCCQGRWLGDMIPRSPPRKTHDQKEMDCQLPSFGGEP